MARLLSVRRVRGLAGFTLLEVMVAVAILGLGLSVILTSQTGLFTSAKRAAQLSEAINLARCKMNEVEEQLLRKGYQLTREDDEGPCCEGDESEFLCRWEILPIELPELGDTGFGADAGAPDSLGGGMGSMDFLGNAEQALAGGNTTDAVGQLGSMLGGGMPGAGPSLGAGALAPMAMGIVYPQLKEMLEASIRRVNVRVVWKEGRTERELAITQYVTNPQQGGLLGEALDAEQLLGGAAGSGGRQPGIPPPPRTPPARFRQQGGR